MIEALVEFSKGWMIAAHLEEWANYFRTTNRFTGENATFRGNFCERDWIIKNWRQCMAGYKLTARLRMKIDILRAKCLTKCGFLSFSHIMTSQFVAFSVFEMWMTFLSFSVLYFFNP